MRQARVPLSAVGGEQRRVFAGGGGALVQQQRGVLFAAQVGLEVPHEGGRGPRARALRRPAGPGARPRSAQDAALGDDAAAQQGALLLLLIIKGLGRLLLLPSLVVAPPTSSRLGRRLGGAVRLNRGGALLAKSSAAACAVDGHGDTNGALHVGILFLESAVSRQREAA